MATAATAGGRLLRISTFYFFFFGSPSYIIFIILKKYFHACWRKHGFWFLKATSKWILSSSQNFCFDSEHLNGSVKVAPGKPLPVGDVPTDAGHLLCDAEI